MVPRSATRNIFTPKKSSLILLFKNEMASEGKRFVLFLLVFLKLNINAARAHNQHEAL